MKQRNSNIELFRLTALLQQFKKTYKTSEQLFLNLSAERSPDR